MRAADEPADGERLRPSLYFSYCAGSTSEQHIQTERSCAGARTEEGAQTIGPRVGALGGRVPAARLARSADARGVADGRPKLECVEDADERSNAAGNSTTVRRRQGDRAVRNHTIESTAEQSASGARWRGCRRRTLAKNLQDYIEP